VVRDCRAQAPHVHARDACSVQLRVCNTRYVCNSPRPQALQGGQQLRQLESLQKGVEAASIGGRCSVQHGGVLGQWIETATVAVVQLQLLELLLLLLRPRPAGRGQLNAKACGTGSGVHGRLWPSKGQRAQVRLSGGSKGV
jgi:hypothetical protein